MKEIVMPKLSDTMTEGKLIHWKKKVGDTIKRGDIIAEVETDKANMELEAYASGVLLEILVDAGESAEVGTVIGKIGAPEEAAAGKGAAEKKEAPPAQAPAPAQAAPTQAAPTVPAQEPPAEAAAAEQEAKAPAEEGEPVQARPPEKEGAAPLPAEEGGGTEPGEEFISAVAGGAGKEPVAPPAPTPPEARGAEGGEERPAPGGGVAEIGGGGERAAPVVRRRARELGVELSQVRGTGPEGRILLEDVEKFAGAAPEGKEAPPAGEEAPPAPERKEQAPRPGEARALSRQRAAIARTVSESWRSIPHFGVTVEVLMDDAEKLRQELKESGAHLSVNDLVVKGAALALEKFPQLNASFAGDTIVQGGDVNICIAVTLPDGLVMPVVSRCQQLSVREIAERSRALVERARSGQLTEQEMTGGTFSVSNLGMFGVSQFNAIIYPSQAAVLAVGGVADTIVAKEGVPVVAKAMKLTLSADHRVVDGAYAAQFLQELKGILEHPLRLLL